MTSRPMPTLRLGEILEPFEELLGERPEPAILTLTERRGFVAQAERYSKRLASDDTSGYRIVRRYDVAFNPYLLWAGAVAQNVDWDEAIISPVYPTFRPRQGVDPRYVAHLLGSPFMRAEFDAVSFGSVPRRRRASVEDFLAIVVPLPPLPEQRRIAALLDKADAIRRKRQQAIRLADDLLRSTFLEMFGDPITNPKGWPLQRLDEIAAVNRGKFTPRPRNDPSYYGGPFPFIQTGDLSGCTGVLRTWHQSLNKAGTEVSRRFPRGTIAMAIAANIGDTVILDFDSYFPDSVVGIEVNADEATTEYVEACLRFFQGLLKGAAPETAQKNINLEVLRPLRVPKPPVESQRKFSDFFWTHVHNADRLAVAQDQVDNLFHSLVQRAFRAEI